MSSTRYKVCSQCGAHMVRRENVMTTSHPSLYIYDCPECGKVEYDIHMYPCGDDACGLVCSETVDYKKLYEEALERARENYELKKTMGLLATADTIEAIFPELRESYDERIRKKILKTMEASRKYSNFYSDEEIAWVKKQKDSIPYEKYVMDIAAMSAEMRTKYSAGWNAGYETKQKEQKLIPLMNGDADLYFDDLRMATQHVLTSREWFDEGIKYAQRLQKEQKPSISCGHENDKPADEDEKMRKAIQLFDWLNAHHDCEKCPNLIEMGEGNITYSEQKTKEDKK